MATLKLGDKMREVGIVPKVGCEDDSKTVPATIKRDHMKPVLTLRAEATDDNHKSKTEFFILYPGDVFTRFGGSSRGLLCRKTPSLITRYSCAGHVQDTEYALESANPWEIIANYVNGLENFKLTAEAAKGDLV